MKYEFEKVVDGLTKYMDQEIYSGMNDWQAFAARVMVGRFINNQENIKNMLINNGFIRTFGIIDKDGMVDVSTLAEDIKRELTKSEKITFEIPVFGKYTFTPSDIDVIYYSITGEEMINNEIH